MNTQRLQLSCNGAPVLPAEPVRVFPGTNNRLTVAWTGPADDLVARVTSTSPHGAAHSEVAPLVGGQVEMQLGPLCAPAEYAYESGVVYRQGYTVRIALERQTDGRELACATLAAVCSQDADAEWLLLDAPRRSVYNDGYIPEGETWNPFTYSAAAMQPALQARLDPAVLADRDRVVIRYRTRPEPEVAAMSVQLRITDGRGQPMIEPTDLQADTDWHQIQPDVCAWPDGVYTIELLPHVGGVIWPDGPRLRYRREAHDPDRVRISPYAPFSLQRDPTRSERHVTTWPEVLPTGWSVAHCGRGAALLCEGDPDGPTVTLDPNASGHYAVFVEPVNTLHIRIGSDDILRRVHEPECDAFGGVFAHVADLTGQRIELYPDDMRRLLDAAGDDAQARSAVLPLYASDGTRSVPFPHDRNGGEIRSGVRALRLVPVTAESVHAFHEATMQPPFELRGVDDWWCHFLGSHRVEPGQLDTIMRCQREVGIRTLNWAVGRSWVQYPSRLPDADMFPCVEIDPTQPLARRQHWIAWSRILRSCDALGYPLARRARHDVRLQGWLAMNRHYGANVHGGVFTSSWARSHSAYYQHHKDLATVDYSRMEYYFPEARRERLDILEEVARYNPDGIVLGCCRQPPMAGYHPDMVAHYKRTTGIDPTRIDSDDGQVYLDWITWRAGFFTQLLRELSQRLEAVEADLGRPVPVVARVPGVGLQWNLAQGMDVRTWVTQRLIDELQLDPLECAGGRASHDVEPYVALGRAHGVAVFGGVNGTTGANRGYGSMDDFTPVAGLRRAVGLLRAGVDGIEIYEAELFARCCERRWLIPLWGDPDRAEQWLEMSNLDAVFPVTARNAALGHDNHWFGGETLTGVDTLPRGARRAL